MTKQSNNPKAGSLDSSKGKPNRREQLRAQQLKEAQRQRQQRILIVGAIVLAVLIVLIVGVSVVQHLSNSKKPAAGTQIIPPNANADHSAIKYEAEVKKNIPTVTVIMDFQCPGCAYAHKQLVPTFEKLADDGRINLEFQILHMLDSHFPGQHSERAVIAATCSDQYNIFPHYARTIFEHQPATEGDGWTDDELMSWAQEVGLPAEKVNDLRTCLVDRQTSDFVNEMQSKLPDYVTATPSFVTNGKLIDNKNINEQAAIDEDKLFELIESYQ